MGGARVKNAVGWGVLGLVALVVASFLAAKTRRGATCLLCRAERTEWEYLGLRWSHASDDGLGRWYAAHVEPEHAHLWEPSPCYYETNLWGSSLGSGCYTGRHPIWTLAPATQKAVYRKLADPPAARVLFAGLADDRGDTDRGDRVVRALGEWEAAGFPGTWDAWWSGRSATPPSPRPRRGLP